MFSPKLIYTTLKDIISAVDSLAICLDTEAEKYIAKTDDPKTEAIEAPAWIVTCHAALDKIRKALDRVVGILPSFAMIALLAIMGACAVPGNQPQTAAIAGEQGVPALQFPAGALAPQGLYYDGTSGITVSAAGRRTAAFGVTPGQITLPNLPYYLAQSTAQGALGHGRVYRCPYNQGDSGTDALCITR
jgi:hypothetical protein